MEDSEQISPHLVIDLEDMGCGDLVIALMKTMRKMQVGEVLKARALDKGAAADIPAWCNMRRHKLLRGPCEEENAWYYIRKEN